MGIYSINPKIAINSSNITNIMRQLISDISNSIKLLIDIINMTIYNQMISIINEILNNYLKIYNFNEYGINNLYIQIYNQNIVLISFITIRLDKTKYTCEFSNWNDFIDGLYTGSPTIIYQELTQEQKNDLNLSILTGKLYFINNVNFIFNDLDTQGIILKINNFQPNSQYTNISTMYWN